MKFLPIFCTMLVLFFMGLFLGGFLLFENPYVLTAILALIGSVLIYVYMQQSDRMDALEKRIRELEEKKEG